jgi:dihydropteroate synthase
MLSLEYLADLVRAHEKELGTPVIEFAVGNRHFAFNQEPAVMGVINLSADSWYRESVCLSLEAAVQRARVLAAQGADVIDVGAESTLAHAARIGEQEQRSKVIPLLQACQELGVPFSIETYNAQVARAALEAGAAILNLTGTAGSEEIYRMARDYGAAVILCYVQGKNVREVGDFEFSADPLKTMEDYFRREIELAEGKGLRKLFLDPGLGFYYKNLQDSSRRIRYQMETFLQTFRLRKLGYPICHALPHAFEVFGEDVRIAEPFFAVLAALGKTNLFRTHEVSKTKAVLNTLKLL